MESSFLALTAPRMFTLPWINHFAQREHLGAILIISAFGLYLTQPSLSSPLLPLAIVLIWTGVAFIGISRPHKVIIACIVVIVASAWLAVPLSQIYNRSLVPTIWLAILTTVLIPLAWTARPKLVFNWMVPLWLLHALISIYQWFTVGGRVPGLGENQNASAAFLLLGCVHLLNGEHGRTKWLLLPLVAAMPYMGSRWVAVVAAVVFVALFASRHIDWRYIAVGIISALGITFALSYDEVIRLFLNRGDLVLASKGHIIGYSTLELIFALSNWIPKGFYDSGIHSLPIRLMHETGILSSLAWLGGVIWVLRTKRFRAEWWMMLCLLLLSVMYYHIWIGPLGGFWWLLVAKQEEGSGAARSLPANGSG